MERFRFGALVEKPLIGEDERSAQRYAAIAMLFSIGLEKAFMGHEPRR
ncbi:hypothetical protein SAMN05216525_112160 [Bradyrhizobium sp. Gha]|nr:hypothetical protein SAMN05216525_112160 [Bradyrhizobium sp. Gha]